GIRVSRDSGATWQLALASTAIRGLVADPKDVLHQVAWSNVAGSPDSVFETKDGWVNYEAIGAGVPTTVLAAGIDHFTGRVYVSVFPAGGVANQTLIYRRVAGIFRLAEAPQFQNVSPKSIGVAPAREACITDTQLECEDCDGNPATLGKCQIYPTVIAGTMVSRDGGTTWQNPGRIQGLFSSSPVNTIETVIFDKDYATNKRLYAVSGSRIIRSDGSRAPLPDDTLIWT